LQFVFVPRFGGLPMKAEIQISRNPLPTRWSYIQEDGHAHSGPIMDDGQKYTAGPPPGGWPFCCRQLHWVIDNELSSGGL
jgi:hypothetical protein